MDQIGVNKINPLKMTKVLNTAMGNIDFAKVLQDENLLIGCNKEEQAAKALKPKEISGVKYC